MKKRLGHVPERSIVWGKFELFLCFSWNAHVLDPIVKVNIARGKVSFTLHSKQPVCFASEDEKSPKLTHILLLASRATGLATSNALLRPKR